MESYAGLSRIYDKTIGIDYQKWMDFLLEYFGCQGIQLRGKKLLELGCGTGNMTMKLRENGMDVTGVDLSSDMLDAAMDKALKRRYKILFVNQDMTSFHMNKTYDFVFSFCDAYNYLLEEEDLNNSFTAVYRHLKEGGYFLFDISSSYKLKTLIGNRTFTQNEEDICYIWDNYREDPRLEMYITFFIQEGQLYRRVNEKHIQRAWELEEIHTLLENVGFCEIECYEDYSFSKPSEESTRVVFICKKEN